MKKLTTSWRKKREAGEGPAAGGDDEQDTGQSSPSPIPHDLAPDAAGASASDGPENITRGPSEPRRKPPVLDTAATTLAQSMPDMSKDAASPGTGKLVPSPSRLQPKPVAVDDGISPGAGVRNASPGGKGRPAVAFKDDPPKQIPAAPSPSSKASTVPGPVSKADSAKRSLIKPDPASSSARGPDPAAEAAQPAKKPPPRRKLEKAKFNIHLDHITKGIAVLYALWLLLVIKLANPSLLVLAVSVVVGFSIGLLLSFLYYKNRRTKEQLNHLLSFDPGVKGLKHLVGTLPSWVNYTEREKLEWLNKIMKEVWPFYDRAICEMVKEQVGPIMDGIKPPGIVKKLGFKELTFGDAPFRVEGFWVKEEATQVLLEVDVRWCGDANITLAIDMPAGGEATRLCPKVTDIVFVGTLRIALKPMVEQIPGFAAALVSLKRPPIIRYRLDFGRALGGQYTAAPVKALVDTIIKSLLMDMLVWPNRIMVPMLFDEASQQLIESVALRPRGVLRVHVIRADGLKKMDTLGSSDPMIEMWVQASNKLCTSTKKNTQTPDWDEFIYLIVQEPTEELLKLEMHDIDTFNAKGLATLNVKQVLNSREFMGRTSVELAPVTKAGSVEPAWYHLGKGEWSSTTGQGRGYGRVQLAFEYRPFGSIDRMTTRTAKKGILLVRVMGARDLALANPEDQINVYVSLKCAKLVQNTPAVRSAGAPRYADGNLKHWYNIDSGSVLKLEVMESGVGFAELLGSAEVFVSEVSEADSHVLPMTGKPCNGFQQGWFPLQEGQGEVEMQVMFVPHF